MKLNQKIIDAASKLMEMITEDYHWYTDTPEQPFEYSEGSIWLINPETEKWMLELEKSGDLWYYYGTSDIFSMYLNMEVSDFKSFIKIWVEDVLKRGVISTREGIWPKRCRVEDVLKRGVISTTHEYLAYGALVEDVLKRGVNSTDEDGNSNRDEVEDVLENGKQWN